MSSACTCHIDKDMCWWCLYTMEQEKVENLKRALKRVRFAPKEYAHKIVDEELKVIKD